MSSVIVKLQGGLGNQLFILSAGFIKAMELDCDLKVDLSEYSGDNPRTVDVWDILHRNQISVSDERPKSIFVEKSPYNFDSKFNRIKPSTLMIGYFQSAKYFEGYHDLLRKFILGEQFRFVEDITENRIGLHMRRGDYLEAKTRRFHGLTKDEYFIDCVNIVRSIWGNLDSDIFSDSPNIARQMTSQISDSSYFDDSKMTTFEVLIELTRRKFLIGSNSSFSWWASFLRPRKYGEVFFPRKWNNVFTVKELKLESWIQI